MKETLTSVIDSMAVTERLQYYAELSAQNAAFLEEFEVALASGSVTEITVAKLLDFLARNQVLIEAPLSPELIRLQIGIRRNLFKILASALNTTPLLNVKALS